MAHARDIAALRIVCLLASDWVTRRRTPRTTGRSRCALVGCRRAWPPLPELTGSYLHCGGRGGSSLGPRLRRWHARAHLEGVLSPLVRRARVPSGGPRTQRRTVLAASDLRTG